jgi:probable HAF family extracellular repeat protein
MKRIPSGATLLHGAVFAAALLATAAQAAPARWTIAEIGAFGSTGSSANAINNRGQVVGASNKAIAGHIAEVSRCFIWESGAMQDIGTPSFDTCQAFGITDRGTVVAWTGYGDQAWLWKDGQWTYAAPGIPLAINRFDAIVGSYWNGAGYRGYYARDGVLAAIGTLGGNGSNASSLNDKGFVVGSASVDDARGVSHAFVWKDGVMTDLGTLPGKEDSHATDINNNGVIVGYSTTTWVDRTAFIADVKGGMRALLRSSGWSHPTAINDRGAVVGLANDRGFLYDDGTLLYLDSIPQARSAGWTNLAPLDINDRGWIVGTGSHNGQRRSFVLIPRDRGCNNKSSGESDDRCAD